MDPKQLNQLDPKLKAAYDRVMSTTITPTTNVAHPPTPTPPPASAPIPPPHPSPVTSPAAPPPAATPKPHPSNLAIPQPPTTIAQHSAIPKVAEPPQTKSKVSPIVLIIGGVIFIAVYAMLWMNFFQIPIPFLSQ